MEVKEDGPSFPSNYVTIHDLKQRWLKQQIPKKSNHDSELNPKPTTNDDSKIPPVPRRSINQPKSPPPEAVEQKKQHQQSKPELKTKPFSPHNDAAALVKEQHQQQSRNQIPKHKTMPFPPPSDGYGRFQGGKEIHICNVSHTKEGYGRFQGGKEIHICNVSHTKEGYGRFQGGPEQQTWSRSNRYQKAPSRGKKGEMSQVWVKKGESALN